MNTPLDAIFAEDDSIRIEPEDIQSLRSLAERGTLEDNKDESIAAIFPEVATEWNLRRDAEQNPNRFDDKHRWERLRPFGVSWLSLPSQASTEFPCPFHNAAIAVLENFK